MKIAQVKGFDSLSFNTASDAGYPMFPEATKPSSWRMFATTCVSVDFPLVPVIAIYFPDK